MSRRPLIEAAREAWIVSTTAAPHLTRLVAVGRLNRFLGVFEILGHEDVPVPPGESRRVRFDLRPVDEVLTQSLDGRVIQSRVYDFASDYLSGDHPEPSDEDRRAPAEPSRQPAAAPPPARPGDSSRCLSDLYAGLRGLQRSRRGLTALTSHHEGKCGGQV